MVNNLCRLTYPMQWRNDEEKRKFVTRNLVSFSSVSTDLQYSELRAGKRVPWINFLTNLRMLPQHFGNRTISDLTPACCFDALVDVIDSSKQSCHLAWLIRG
jgi:hypothetical protein